MPGRPPSPAATNNNGRQASWTGDVWPRAAEIIRCSYKGWSDSDVAKFQNMLTTQYLPSIVKGTCENGNKELTMSEALINIGVFNDNRAGLRSRRNVARPRPAYITGRWTRPSTSRLRCA
jgi:hypothetical protein